MTERFPDGTPIDPWFYQTEIPGPDSLGRQYVLTGNGIQPDESVHTAEIQAMIDRAAENGARRSSEALRLPARPPDLLRPEAVALPRKESALQREPPADFCPVRGREPDLFKSRIPVNQRADLPARRGRKGYRNRIAVRFHREFLRETERHRACPAENRHRVLSIYPEIHHLRSNSALLRRPFPEALREHCRVAPASAAKPRREAVPDADNPLFSCGGIFLFLSCTHKIFPPLPAARLAASRNPC